MLVVLSLKNNEAFSILDTTTGESNIILRGTLEYNRVGYVVWATTASG